jgi:hypothetical protein
MLPDVGPTNPANIKRFNAYIAYHRKVGRLPGRETEPWEIIYFKLYKSQLPVVEQAIETAALMLGSDKSRGYCLEMICADFLAGANLENENPRDPPAVGATVLQVPPRRRAADISAPREREGIVNQLRPKQPRLRLEPELYEQLRDAVLRRDGWRCQFCGTRSSLEVITRNSVASQATIRSRI